MNHAQVNTSWKVTIVADLSAERRAFEEAEVNRRMNLGALVTCFVPLLHNRLSRQLGQLSTPPTLFSLCSPFLPSSSALSLSLSLFLFLGRALALFSLVLPSVSFIPTPSFYSFLPFLTTSILRSFCCLSFLSEPIPLCHVLTVKVRRY